MHALYSSYIGIIADYVILLSPWLHLRFSTFIFFLLVFSFLIQIKL